VKGKNQLLFEIISYFSQLRYSKCQPISSHPLKIQPQRPVLDIIQIVLDAPGNGRVAPETVYLRLAGD
jgi:hypothetical protein